jgi:hypothetical protein
VALVAAAGCVCCACCESAVPCGTVLG